jgi:hypothetical protein
MQFCRRCCDDATTTTIVNGFLFSFAAAVCERGEEGMREAKFKLKKQGNLLIASCDRNAIECERSLDSFRTLIE